MKGIEASAKHFYNLSNLKQCNYFADKVMESLESVFERHHRDYSMQFLLHLSPVFLGRTKDLVRFK